MFKSQERVRALRFSLAFVVLNSLLRAAVCFVHTLSPRPVQFTEESVSTIPQHSFFRIICPSLLRKAEVGLDFLVNRFSLIGL